MAVRPALRRLGFGAREAPPPAPTAPTLSYDTVPAAVDEGDLIYWPPSVGGSPLFTFTIELGSLPDGLTLDPSSGVVSGTVAAGAFASGPSYSATIRVTNAAGFDEYVLEVDVNEPGEPPADGDYDDADYATADYA